MKSLKTLATYGSLLLLLLVNSSCISDSQSSKQASDLQDPSSSIADQPSDTSATQHVSLPVRYQTPSYVVERKPESDPSIAEEARLKVEAKITSTKGPQPLWDIIKRLASLKGMNVSWASDVDRNVLVDVNINANDDFFGAIDNLLRQVDYFHEVEGSTIIVKYKETRQFHVAMPFIKQTYRTKTGGDLLGGGGGASGTSNVAGEISLMAEGAAINQHKDGTPGGVEFNTWSSIENNLNALLNIWTTETVTQDSSNKTEKQDTANQQVISGKEEFANEQAASATFRKSKEGNSYFIDKPVGLITATAPRPLLTKLDDYFKALQKELYKQVSIEAKILEVTLDDSSSIGLDWNRILSSLSMAGASLSGSKTYSKNETDDINSSNTLTSTNTATRTNESERELSDSRAQTFNNQLLNPLTGDTGTSDRNDSNILTNTVTGVVEAAALSGASTATIVSNGLTGALGGTISLAAFTFDSFLNAVSKQGQATILSNPKLSVLNGQPALITVGKNVTYIETIEVNVSDSGVITYSAETARALSGIGMALTANIIDDQQIILNLVPVTSELVEPIEYRSIGLGQVGLPIINVREMSTTIKVKNGEMLVIGGLISSATASEGTFIPGTSNLSFFKYLFGAETKSKKKRELIILLQPRII